MDKILTRKLFKNVYLQSVSKNIARFKEGGLASLRAKRFQVGGPVYSEGERQAMILAPIVSSLLTGTRQPGQSQLGAVASNIGAAIPQVVKTRLDIDKAETERLDQLAKLAKLKQDEINLLKIEREKNNKEGEKKNVFAKLKSYNKDSSLKSVSIPGDATKQSKPTKEEDKNKIVKENANRYSYEGKIANYQFIKKVDRKVVDKRYGMSFADFKKMQKN